MRKSALITGVTGQVGSYLAEMLLAIGYQVHGTTRRISGNNRSNSLLIAPSPLSSTRSGSTSRSGCWTGSL